MPYAVCDPSDAEFTHLLQSVESLYISGKESLGCIPIATLANPYIRQQQLGHNDRRDEYLEFQDVRFVPFDFETVSRSMWRYCRETSSPTTVHVDDRREAFGNTILRTYSVAVEGKNGVTSVQGNQVMRRYVHDGSVVIVRMAFMKTTNEDSSTTFIERGWMQLEEVPQEKATLVRGLSSIVPHGSHERPVVIPDFMTTSRAAMEDKAMEMFENILFEEASKARAK